MSAAPCNCPDFKCRCDLSIQSKCLECRAPKNVRDLIYCRCMFALCVPCYEKLYPGHDSTGPCVACDCELELHPVVHYLQVQLRRAEYVLALAGQPSDAEDEEDEEQRVERSDGDGGNGGSDCSELEDAEEETNPASGGTHVATAPPAAAPGVPSFLPPPTVPPAAHATNVIPPFVFVLPALALAASTKRPLESSPESFGRLSKRRVIDLD